MELHHHHNSDGKKNWKNYLFEFFMLFLAVFCGFLAEWQLEQSIERQHEKQFIQSLAEDLKRDTFEVAAYIRFNETVLTYCDSVQLFISGPGMFTNSNCFYNYSRRLAGYIRYYPTDRTMQQLKNGGNMRLIQKWNVSNEITEYDSKTKLLSELDQQLNSQISKYRNYLIEFLDLSSYDKLNKPGSFMDNNTETKGNPGFITNDPGKAKIIYNQVFTLRIFLSANIKSAGDVSMAAKRLLGLLEKEYSIH
jgi:hypothetical protein